MPKVARSDNYALRRVIAVRGSGQASWKFGGLHFSESGTYIEAGELYLVLRGRLDNRKATSKRDTSDNPLFILLGVLGDGGPENCMGNLEQFILGPSDQPGSMGLPTTDCEHGTKDTRFSNHVFMFSRW